MRDFIKTAKAPTVAQNPTKTKPPDASPPAAGDGLDVHETRSFASESTQKKPKIWHPQQEKLLKQWAEIATSFRWMHHRAHLRYASMHFWFTLPVIVMSSITGTMNFAQGTFPPEYETYIPLIIGSINLIAGIITTIASYLRVSELSEGNRVASIMFGKLSRNIRVELLLPISERTMDGGDFIAMCRSELDRLTEQTPDIPSKIESKFVRQFEQLLKTTDFYPPELRDLHPVEIYTGDLERKQSQMSNVVANAALLFQQGVKKPVQSDPDSEDMMPPVPEVALKVPPAPTASALLAEDSKTQRAQELNALSGMQSVTNRLKNRAQSIRLQSAAGAHGSLKAVELVALNAQNAMTQELGAVVKDVGGAGKDVGTAVKDVGNATVDAARDAKEVVIDISPPTSTFFEPSSKDHE